MPTGNVFNSSDLTPVALRVHCRAAAPGGDPCYRPGPDVSAGARPYAPDERAGTFFWPQASRAATSLAHVIEVNGGLLMP
jgi:hypothetical protein